jgi:RNA polymerase sigma-70 factor, ECF subfamily
MAGRVLELDMDNELFWKLLEPVHPTAAAFCRKLAGNRDEGDDLYQEAVLTAMRKFHDLRDLASFRPWLFRIIVNTCKNRYRGIWRRRRETDTDEVILESSAGCDPRAEYESRRLLGRVMAVLSAEDRALVILHEIQGWSWTELAAMTRQPEGTVKTRLFRARRKMRDWLMRHLPESNGHGIQTEATYALQGSQATDD